MPSIIIGHRRLGQIEVLVSDSDLERVSQHRWYVFQRRKATYIRGVIDGRSTLLHRFITGCPDQLTVDHIDGDPINNTRENLRVCSVGDNVAFAWERGGYSAHQAQASHQNTVRKRMADGSVKTFVYDRRAHRPRKNQQTTLQTVAFSSEKCDSQENSPTPQKRSDLNDLVSVVGDVGLEPTTR
jgi:hypothetical protein